MSAQLIKLNQLVRSERNVYVASDVEKKSFDYSDGEASEVALKNILEAATDLSSTSYELKKQIVDWPTEYHLSPIRANLLRALDLSGVKRVLEMGCGCGSITRYLGEQDGIEVDAVEGSLARAELAALRCRDQNNVTICAGNINEIEFPENYYDLVLFVGVTEYAGRFSDAPTDQQAVQELLAVAKKATTNDGVVLVAIENRTGFKYVMGAGEDHYAMPYVGLHDYLDFQGIRTYTKNQWQEQIEEAEFSHHQFIYPFPDYKMPTVFLSDSYINKNRNSFAHLEAQTSRDYMADFSIQPSELLLWESASVSQTLGDYANSFLILMGDSNTSIQRASEYDFMHLPNFSEKLEYCHSTYKKKNNNMVNKQSLVDSDQQSIEQQYQQGLPLSVRMMQVLSSFKGTEKFDEHLKQYFDFLQKTDSLFLDMTPDKLLLLDQTTENNEPQLFPLLGRESGQTASTAQAVYFRGMLKFYELHADLIIGHDAFRDDVMSLRSWVDTAFSAIGLTPSQSEIESWLELDNGYRQKIEFNFQPLDIEPKIKEDPVEIIPGDISAEINTVIKTKITQIRSSSAWQTATDVPRIKSKLVKLSENILDKIRK